MGFHNHRNQDYNLNVGFRTSLMRVLPCRTLESKMRSVVGFRLSRAGCSLATNGQAISPLFLENSEFLSVALEEEWWKIRL